MKIDEFNKLMSEKKGKRKKPDHRESHLQRECVKWFRLQYYPFRNMLFSVPNGGCRNPIEAKIMKAEGVVPGVSDLILLVARKGFYSLCLEAKTEVGIQSDNQIVWQADCEANGNKYMIFRSVNEFINIINWYMK